MEVGRLPISASLRGKLISAGYTTFASLSSLSPSDLARDLKIPESEALEILKAASLDCGLDKPDKSNVIVNGGLPGIGKTQMGIQLAVNVQIPVDLGGLGGKAVYVDTEGSFMVERALQIAKASIVEMSNYTELLKKKNRVCQVDIQPTDILDNIFYFRICTYTEQIALINYLDKFILEHKDVKIVIVDSVTFHFRQDFEDLALRTRLLGGMALKLMNLAKKYNLAVVIFNQATTKYVEGSFQLSLALGDSWSHCCTNRVILHWNGDERNAYLDKSPSLRSASAPFSVTSEGIRNSASNHKRIKLM
ncbi:DNA repair protein RAD51 homolog 3-like isoform X5 [Malus sylvestris]|uniref:DNA repair protein RAD51 homolog 3-like isoform X5 n=1 Tax=Malus sylvestris TaxID=3752 RepID=UPI0010A9A610|nr:DNA repair protein RAD51 homolog 3-like isoform X5 [Malus domestica]XP_050157007.1 DNA repair protein RAD51 homolog 3-like isoform X5 [Malus sylvestris]